MSEDKKRDCVLCFYHGEVVFPIQKSDELETAKVLEEWMVGPPSVATWRSMHFRTNCLIGFYFRDALPSPKEWQESQRRFQEETLRLMKRDTGDDEPWRESLEDTE